MRSFCECQNFQSQAEGHAATSRVSITLGKTSVVHANRNVSAALFAFIMIVSIAGLAGMFGFRVPALVGRRVAPAAPFGIVNQYGLFANMTTSRPEISIEGSNDAVDWQPYIFPLQAGSSQSRARLGRALPTPARLADVVRRPGELPRESMAAAFHACAFCKDLLRSSNYSNRNPFAGKPPKYIRAMVYDYRFTTSEERRQTGNWWKRELKGTYFPPISLRN